jgi:hypothetical protein
MDALVWTLAGIYVLNLLLLALSVVVLEVKRHRKGREIRELESLWLSPTASAVLTVRGTGSRLRTRGGHMATVVRKPGRPGAVRRASLALALASLAGLMVAAFLDPGAGRTITSAREPVGPAFVPEPKVPRLFLVRDPRSDLSVDDRVAPEMSRDPSSTTWAATSDGEPVSAVVVAAQPRSSTAIRLMWAEVPAAIGYEIERKDDGSAKEPNRWREIATIEKGVTAYTDAGLASETTYYYRVSALIEGGAGPPSDVVSATTPEAPPSAPWLTADASSDAVTLSWTDVADETGYRIERLADGDTDWVTIATTGEDVTTYTNGGLSPESPYKYRVVATGPGGDSEPSNVASATTVKVAVAEPPDPVGESSAPEPSPSPASPP